MSYESLPSLSELQEVKEANDMGLASEALQLTIDAVNQVCGVFPSTEYEIISREEEASATFPVHLEHGFEQAGIDGRTQVVINLPYIQDTFPYLAEVGLEGEGLSDVLTLYVAGSVIPHLLLCAIPRDDPERLRKLTLYMYEAEQIDIMMADDLLELGEENLEHLRLLMDTRTNDQLAEINRLRLAFGILDYFLKVDGGAAERHSPVQALSEYSKSELSTIATRTQEYADLSAAWLPKDGSLKDFSRLMYLEEVPPVIIAAAYPMDANDVMIMAKILNGGSK